MKPPSRFFLPCVLIFSTASLTAPARVLPTVDAILDHVVAGAKPGDVVCVFSNGGFGNLHERLLQRLAGCPRCFSLLPIPGLSPQAWSQ